jgi:NAD(P)-dependent dehydrogenase (short-subunit alcohol dehydrogenase family)
MGLLEGRVALVTGAGRGIGAAAAKGLAAEGACVVVNDLGADVHGEGIDTTPAQEVVDAIVKDGGVAMADGTNVTDFEACEAMIHRTVKEFGRLDVLINVAGILRDRMIFKMTEEEWDAVIDVHLKGTFNTTRHASTWWRENRGGQYRLINFTSGSGIGGAPSQPNYAAAKMGIIGLTLSCANALRPYGVTSNCIAPVATTRMTLTVPTGKTSNQYTAENRKLAPENVVPPILYLASTRSDWLNRKVIGAGNGRISLYEDFAVNREIVSTDGEWDLPGTFDEMEATFKAHLEYPNYFDRPKGN